MQAFLIEDKVYTIKIVDHTMPICLIHKAGVDAIINTTRGKTGNSASQTITVLSKDYQSYHKIMWW